MGHMVIFKSVEGKYGYHQAEALEDAVRFVEHLRNSEAVTDSRIFRLQEVPIEFKTYFRVEVVPAGAEAQADGAGQAAVAAAEEAPQVDEPVDSELVGAAQASGGIFGFLKS